MKKNIKTILIALISIILLIAIDQGTKFSAVKILKDHSSFVILDGVFEFTYTINQGAAFGILQQKQLLFMILTGLVLVAVVWLYLFRIPNDKKFRPFNVVCILLISGTLGNFLDRVRLGYVVDFMYFKLIDFPVFNVADCYITLSCALFLILILFIYKEDDLQGIL
ncbi:MAG: signal peptidase II [Clostridiales bacterium]|nr:signal peptidase II [Clostridiales bacterium]